MVMRMAPSLDEPEGTELAHQLARSELSGSINAHYLGSWCWADGTVSYVTFVPNMAFTAQGSDVLNLVVSMTRRARWFAETLYEDDWDANLGDDGRTLALPAILQADDEDSAHWQ